MKLNGSTTLLLSAITVLSGIVFTVAQNEVLRAKENAVPALGSKASAVGNSQKLNKTRNDAAIDKLGLLANAKKDFLTVGEQIMLRLVLRNDGAEEVYIVETRAAKDNKIEIKKATGEKLPLSEKGRKILESEPVRRVVSPVGPGDEVKYEIDVSELYDLTTAGTYTITVKRQILMHDKRKFAEIESNSVTVTVRQ